LIDTKTPRKEKNDETSKCSIKFRLGVKSRCADNLDKLNTEDKEMVGHDMNGRGKIPPG